ncbi:MAG: hypothetical protein HXL05_02605 [Candidatus Nanosynbacter sp.]|nr:hypothetical protein [Candidatus Nanosynbacter sp.]
MQRFLLNSWLAIYQFFQNLGYNIQRFWMSRWRVTFIYVLVLISSYIIFGLMLSDDYFNKHFSRLAVLKELSTIIEYIGLLFAVQIPVFILLLEKIRDSGDIRRFSLPNVIYFREILATYIILSSLLLVSPRASYYYFPTIIIVAVSLYAMVQSMQLLFGIGQLKQQEKKHIKDLVKRSLMASKMIRANGSIFFADLENSLYVIHRLFTSKRDKRELKKHYLIRASKAGVIKSINVKRLDEIITREYYNRAPQTAKKQSVSRPSDKKIAQLILSTRPGSDIEDQSVIMELVLSDNLPAPHKRLERGLLDCIKIDPDYADSPNRQLEVLVKGFRQQLRGAIEKDDEIAVDDALVIYELLTNATVEEYSNESKDFDYATAKSEFEQIFGDSVSRHLQSTVDIIDEAFFYALRTERRDATKSIISSVYRSLLNVFDSFNIVVAARLEKIFTHAMSRTIYDTTLENTHYKEYVLELLAFRLKEHTGLLLYNYRECDESSSFSREQLEQWLNDRLSNMTSFLLDTYKKSQTSAFKEVKSIFNEVESNYRLYHQEIKELVWTSRSRLFMVAAYIHDRTDLTREQEDIKKIMDNYLGGFSAQDLTKILVKCVDNNYASEWQFDIYDLPADRKMHLVPDFNLSLKSLWVERMLALDSIPEDIEYYGRDDIARTGTFSDFTTREEKPFIIRRLAEMEEQGEDISTLSKLVKTFIDERMRYEDEKLIAAPLDQDEVAEFKEGVLAGYRDYALAFSVFAPNGHLKTTKATKGFLSYGWNQIQDKYGFVKDWHIGTIHQPHSYGSEIAESENKHILESLFSKPSRIDNFEEWLKRLKRSRKSWFVVSVRTADWYMISDRKDDIGKQIKNDFSTGDMSFKGLNQVVPIYHVYDNYLPKGLYAASVDNLGKLEIANSKDEPIEISIDAYSDNERLLEGTLERQPDWLIEKGDRTAREIFLKTQVRMFIKHAFRYKPKGKRSTFYYPIDDKDSD